MELSDIYERLGEVFEDVFDRKIQITPELTASDVEGWDSLTHIALISAAEDEFGVTFSMKEVLGMERVGDLAALLKEKL